MPPKETSTARQIASRDVASYVISSLLIAALLIAPRMPNLVPAWLMVLVCALLALCGYIVQGVTLSGAVAGFAVALSTYVVFGIPLFVALIAAFIVTSVATRAGRSRKERLAISESRGGRDGMQVLANVGLAGALAIASTAIADQSNGLFIAAALAVLASAAADTTSSEIGKAFGGTPRLITTWRRVAAGENGGITLLGSFAGIGAAIIVIAAAPFWIVPHFYWMLPAVAAACAGGVAGMFFDSLLGATLEGRWLNNDGINFLSTCFAATIADALLLFANHLH